MRSRSSSPRELDGRPPSFSGSATPFNENLKFKLSAKSKLQPNNLAPWRKAQGWIKRVRREEGRLANNDSVWTGLASDSIGWFSAKRLSGEVTLSTTFFRRFFLSLGLVIVTGLLVSVINSDQQPYSVRVDTTRLSPATALPNEFSSHWVGRFFQQLCRTTGSFSNAEFLPKASRYRQEVVSRKMPSCLIEPIWRLESVKSLQLKWFQLNTYADDTLTVVTININCAQGICELLSEHTKGGSALLSHTVILDTGDARIWRAAITTLAQSIAVD